MQRRDYDGVIPLSRQVLAKDPSNEEAIESLGEIFEKSKRWNDLIGVLDRRVKLEEDPAEPRHILTARKAGYRLQP